MIRILASACLLGEPVRYDGGSVPVDDERLRRWYEEGRVVAFCPEVAAGLCVPRIPNEILGGRVVNAERKDVTVEFLAGSRAALAAAQAAGARIAILKDRSPSCGVTVIHDGTFSGRTVPGTGITARLLAENGIAVFSETQIGEAAALLETLERKMKENLS